MPEELPIGQAQHACPQRRESFPGERGLALLGAAWPGAEQHVRAILDQRYEAELRKSTLATTGARAPEGGAVLPGVGHVQAGAIQAD